MRIALGIEYDGAPFNGWQSQANGMTVQDVLEHALAKFIEPNGNERVQVVCAGRTDAGVHASGQVVHLDTFIERDLNAWVRGTNAQLPGTIAVRWARMVPDTFHARFSAMRRNYRYLIYNHPVRSPLWAPRSTWCFRPLDAAAMQSAAQCLLGEHDFSSFRSSECQAKTPVKHVYAIDVVRNGPIVELTIQANAFLHHMVRNIAGSLVYIGLGRCEVDWLTELLLARDRKLAAPTFGAQGLCLTAVDYPSEFQIPDERL
jgi:tRNA pseudouridine38-40 synthase